jgi:hypothetical protein
MKFTVTHAYDKDTKTVFKVLTDESYLVKKFEATGAKNIQILQCSKTGKDFVIRRQMDIPANPPELLKKFVKAMNTVVAKDTWKSFDKDVKTGVFELDIKGVPISMTGTLTLKPTKKGCDYVVEFDAKCSIPLIGGKLLSLAENDTRANQKLDYEFTKKYLENN